MGPQPCYRHGAVVTRTSCFSGVTIKVHLTKQPFMTAFMHPILTCKQPPGPCSQPTCGSQQLAPERVISVARLCCAIQHEHALQRRTLERPGRIQLEPKEASLPGRHMSAVRCWKDIV